MSLSIHKLVLVAPLLLLSGCNLTWPGQGRATSSDTIRNVSDVAALQSSYDDKKYFGDVKRRADGRENAFGRDLDAITATIDRHLFNYSKDDPYVNYPSTVSNFNHLMRFGIDTTYPVVSYLETGAITHK